MIQLDAKYMKYIYYIVMIILVHLLPYGSTFLIKMITLDSLFTSIQSIYTYMNNKSITDSQVILQEPVYTSSLLDRYIYYAIQFILYKAACLFMWRADLKILYYAILTTLVPPLLNRILKSKLFDKIRKRKENIMKIVLSKQIASLVQFTSSTYLSKEITIHYQELLPLFDNYNETISYLTHIAKNTIMTLVLNYVRTYSNKAYYKLIKYIYNYKMNENVKSYTPQTAKIVLSNIVNKKKWKSLLNANVYSAILCLYQENSSNVHVLTRLMTKIKNKFTKMMAIYTISSFFGNIYFVPIISSGLRLHNTDNRILNRENILKYSIHTIAPFVCGHNYILTSMICQFGYDMIFNNVVLTILQYGYKKVKNIINRIIIRNWVYNKFLIATVVHILLYNKYVINGNATQLSTYISSIMLMLDDINKITIYTMLLLSGYISNFNTLHLLCGAGISYAALGYREFIGEEINKLYILMDKQFEITKKTNYTKQKLYRKVKYMQAKYMQTKYITDMQIFKKLKNEPAQSLQSTNKNKFLLEPKKVSLPTKLGEMIKSSVFNLSNTQFIDAISVENDMGGSIKIIDNYIDDSDDDVYR